MIQQVYEGTWEEISLHAAELTGRRLRLITVDGEAPDAVASEPAAKGRLYFGMFQGVPEVTEEDFKLAEWHGEDIDV